MCHHKQSSARFQVFPLIITAVLYAVITVAGCGGSSIDSAGSGSSGLTYSGLRSQAVIEDSNAEALAFGSLRGFQSADSVSSLAVSATSGADVQNSDARPLTLNLAEVLRVSMEQIDVMGEDGLDVQYQRTSKNVFGQKTGDCGGTGAYALTYDESSGAFSGTLNLSGFCSNGVSLDGPASFSGVHDESTDQFDWFNIIFSNLEMTFAGQIFAMDGELDCDFNGSKMDLFIDVLVRNNADEVFWINAYTIHVVSSAITMTGRFYHPRHGYVEITTDTALVINNGEAYPSDGVLSFTGSKGLAGNATTARLEVFSADSCRLQADTHGDGVFDYDTGSMPWAGL